jgi:Mn2+/Fe2+ NRAMP family transporter
VERGTDESDLEGQATESAILLIPASSDSRIVRSLYSSIGKFTVEVSRRRDGKACYSVPLPTQMTTRKQLSTKNVEKGKAPGLLRKFFANLGPGLVTGAADDDPSSIATYSVVGATYGYTPLWTALVTFPMMAAVQLMCARLGMVTGRGLAAAVRIHHPRWVLWGSCSILVVANVINIGADLGGMAEATQLITGIRSLIWIPVYAFFIIGVLLGGSYKLIAKIFKWLTLALFAYVVASFYAHVEWRHALAVTFVPHLEWSRGFLAVFVGILGATISPCLFFWQAAGEVEEERGKGRALSQRKGATTGELRFARTDTITGMFFSNLIMYFIILTTAAGHTFTHTEIEPSIIERAHVDPFQVLPRPKIPSTGEKRPCPNCKTESVFRSRHLFYRDDARGQTT